ncbi:MAG: histidine--tRNA ligase [Phycisphaerales bacterium]|nr:histidine--tRNA ligase [Phycisphaerae bacterium]NNF43816.1 histidine--tRNA ligase [Phycisphaerales bacterium]NNM27198.1 histidine--tRNA ligase [Phycisphaerales bacterium]
MTHAFQAPKGTRDFYPPDMAVRRHLESVWRSVSINHGFEEVDGPTFEHLELYTVKSGPGIVSELFSFRRAGGKTEYALRPEFTPTLGRMVASAIKRLSPPVKWFSIPTMFRAERPQRGRLREHVQWNVDVVGDASPAAELEVLAVLIGVLRRFGLTDRDVTIKLSHRQVVTELLLGAGLDEARLPAAFDLLDRRDKLPAAEFDERAATLGLDAGTLEVFRPGGQSRIDPAGVSEHFGQLLSALDDAGLASWYTTDFGIVRGLAYYTGTVFEVHATSGRERAIAGGGRYDGLVELFGGPPTPAVGVAMGDVVLRLVLEETGRLSTPETYLPRPDVFVINLLETTGLRDRTVAELRDAGLHARHSHRATKKLGKLLSEADQLRARFAVILGREAEEGRAVVKDLAAAKEEEITLDTLATTLRDRCHAKPEDQP